MEIVISRFHLLMSASWKAAAWGIEIIFAELAQTVPDQIVLLELLVISDYCGTYRYVPGIRSDVIHWDRGVL